METWRTEICGYKGHAYTREVSSLDDTVYLDHVYETVAWSDGKPNYAAVSDALAFAEIGESVYCPYCDEYGCKC